MTEKKIRFPSLAELLCIVGIVMLGNCVILLLGTPRPEADLNVRETKVLISAIVGSTSLVACILLVGAGYWIRLKQKRQANHGVVRTR